MVICFHQIWEGYPHSTKFLGGSVNDKEYNRLPGHARLQNMTYSAKIKVNVTIEIVTTESRYVFIGKLPVMVKSDLCWLKDERTDCEFDYGGYFIIKGAEKTFIAQEQSCLKRLLITDNQGITVAYRSEVKRHRLIIRLSGISQLENIEGVEKILSVYFMSAEIPVWIWLFALGVSSDNEVIDLTDYGKEDASISNILGASVCDADQRKDNFRSGKNALRYFEEMITNTTFPPRESIEECISMYLFPNLTGMKQKARFLGYMVKSVLQTFRGHRKCDNREELKNKRFHLAGELLERELKAHIGHAGRRMAKALQRDLCGNRVFCLVEQYLDAAIVTNGIFRAFSTGAWSHPFKRMEIGEDVWCGGKCWENKSTTNNGRYEEDTPQVQYTGKVGDARYP